MKKKITINYCQKRTFNLGDYENIAPIHTITEEIELNEGEDFTERDYQEAFAKIKKLVRNELQEEAYRVKTKDFTYADELTTVLILKEAKARKLDLDEILKQNGYASVLSLTATQATKLLNQIKNGTTTNK